MLSKPLFLRFFTLLLVLVALPGCDNGKPPAPQKDPPAKAAGCTACHLFKLDKNHDIGCTACHDGDDSAATAETAHAGLRSKPANPAAMAEVCGPCHTEMVKLAAHSSHFTLKNEVNMVRKAFGADTDLPSMVDIPIAPSPRNILELVDDLLRRSCLRCHVYYEGDQYLQTIRGTGCAACHLRFEDGEMVSHVFTAPGDDHCLQCHYGNYVGADYYGRYEHDFKWEYRTPYQIDGSYPERPYGVEFHRLAPDIHQQKGMGCLDCHPGDQLKNAATTKTTCESCHLYRKGAALALANLVVEYDQLYIITGQSGRKLKVPRLRHTAHQRYRDKVACVVCHAQWSYNDAGSHLMRQDIDAYDLWTYLSIQGSSEVEMLLETSYANDFDIVPAMTDKITGDSRGGIWYKGFELRRWENPIIGRDRDGLIKIFRPLLDLHLSYVNEDDEVVFDGVAATDPWHGLRPYTPHTTGKAGLFYKQRLQQVTRPVDRKTKSSSYAE